MEIASLCQAAWQRDTTLILLVMGENPTGSVLGGDSHGKHVGAAKGKQYHRQRKGKKREAKVLFCIECKLLTKRVMTKKK